MKKRMDFFYNGVTMRIITVQEYTLFYYNSGIGVQETWIRNGEFYMQRQEKYARNTGNALGFTKKSRRLYEKKGNNCEDTGSQKPLHVRVTGGTHTRNARNTEVLHAEHERVTVYI